MNQPITEYNGKRIVDMGDEELLNTALFENVLVERTVGHVEAFKALRSAILLRMSQHKNIDELKLVCDRDWEDETPEQVIAIAANALYWRSSHEQRARINAKRLQMKIAAEESL